MSNVIVLEVEVGTEDVVVVVDGVDGGITGTDVDDDIVDVVLAVLVFCAV